MRVVRIARCAPVRWRNGGGVTRELGAGEGWRLSLAEIDTPGPFSRYPGLDRVFTLASGAARLSFDSGRESRLDANAAPIEFPGEDAPHCHPDPDAGACRALNLMVARGRFHASLERHQLRVGQAFVADLERPALALFVQRGSLRVDRPGPDAIEAPLSTGDALVAHTAAPGAGSIDPATGGTTTGNATSGATTADESEPTLVALDDDATVILAFLETARERTAKTR